MLRSTNDVYTWNWRYYDSIQRHQGLLVLQYDRFGLKVACNCLERHHTHLLLIEVAADDSWVSLLSCELLLRETPPVYLGGLCAALEGKKWNLNKQKWHFRKENNSSASNRAKCQNPFRAAYTFIGLTLAIPPWAWVCLSTPWTDLKVQRVCVCV